MANYTLTTTTLKGEKHILDKIETACNPEIMLKQAKSFEKISNSDHCSENWLGLVIIELVFGDSSFDLSLGYKYDLKGFLFNVERISDTELIITSEDAWTCATSFQALLLENFDIKLTVYSEEHEDDYFAFFTNDPTTVPPKFVLRSNLSAKDLYYVGENEYKINDLPSAEFCVSAEEVLDLYGFPLAYLLSLKVEDEDGTLIPCFYTIIPKQIDELLKFS